MHRIPLLLLCGLALAACADNTTDPDNPGAGGEQAVTMRSLTDLPRTGGNVTGIAITSNSQVITALDGKLYSMPASGGDLQIINADPVHTAIGVAPSGEIYTVAGTEIRVYNASTGSFTRAPIDPAGPFATNGRIEEAEFTFSPSGEPYVRFISNYPRTYIYRTSDKGTTWEQMDLPPGFAYAGDLVFSAAGDILMSSPFGFYRSTDRGTTWTTRNAPQSGYGGNLVVTSNGDIYQYVFGGGGLRVSRDGGASFTDLWEFNKAPFFMDIQQGDDGALYSLANRKGGGLNAAQGPASLLRSNDGGVTTQTISRLMEDRNGVLYGISETLNQFSQTYVVNSYLSNDGGTTWKEVENSTVAAMAFNSSNRFFAIGAQNSYTLRTPNGGPVSELNLQGYTAQGSSITRALFGPDDRLYLITSDKGLLVSSAPVR